MCNHYKQNSDGLIRGDLFECDTKRGIMGDQIQPTECTVKQDKHTEDLVKDHQYHVINLNSDFLLQILST